MKKLLSLLLLLFSFSSFSPAVYAAERTTHPDASIGGLKAPHIATRNPEASPFSGSVTIDKIIYPLLSTPAIKKSGSTLTLQVDTKGDVPSNWNVIVKDKEDSPTKQQVSLPVQNVSKGTSYWHKSESIYDVTVSLPTTLRDQLYNVLVTYDTKGKTITDEQPNALQIVTAFKKDFRFIHLSDIHVGSPRNLSDLRNAKEAGFWHPQENKRWLYLQKTIQEVNLLKPDFVVLTGDLVYGQLNPLEYTYEYKEAFRMLKKFNVPVYVVPGNHDLYAQDAMLTDGAKYWSQYFGPSYYSFDYGPYAHMVGYNSYDWNTFDRQGHSGLFVPTWGGQVRQDQLNWLKEDWQKTKKSPDQVRAMFSHHNPLWKDRDIWPASDAKVASFWKEYDQQHNPQRLSTLIKGQFLGLKYDQQWHGEGADDLIKLMHDNDVTLALHGHTHADHITEKDGILYATTASIELDGKPWVGYRIFQKKTNQPSFTSYVYEGTHASQPVYANGISYEGTMSLEAIYAQANDGTQKQQTVTLTNRFHEDMTVTVPLYLAQGTYRVSDGTIKTNEAVGTIQKLEVVITIPKNSSKTIQVTPAGT
ncbi:metallophosphoesterase [Fictibacillus macauensis ZFHKF-1]|uniref:Metallophosphoesterase n=1 Tax=Fictibacillus macauensis ZFHKF-1 TaxID=1196324 RepID=I8AJA0_9BACL|nr:metallophosphoesterase [Fictibacillus macauensis]EIT85574.1 metallophosphoesterase [Fictibacillus macauensis ZFHKF-1]